MEAFYLIYTSASLTHPYLHVVLTQDKKLIVEWHEIKGFSRNVNEKVIGQPTNAQTLSKIKYISTCCIAMTEAKLNQPK